MSYDADSLFTGEAGGLVVDGGVDFLEENPKAKKALFVAFAVIAVVLLMLVIWSLVKYVTGPVEKFGGHPNSQRFAGSKSDRDYFTLRPTDDRAAEYGADYNSRTSGFVNSREGPYFPDVTNRVLRMENREKEAVRALGKINQERQRRAAEDTAGTAALAWGPFWKEWKSTHPIDGEAGYVPGTEGFEDREGGYVANFDLAY